MSDSIQNLSSEAMSSNPTNSTQDGTTEPHFPLFRQLPREIRFMIWKLAATIEARRIEINNNEFHMEISSPATLFADFESEFISKEVPSKLFDGQTFAGKTHEIDFCPEKDTIALSPFFRFPLRDITVMGLPRRDTYNHAPLPACDSVRILEIQEDFVFWMYTATHFRSLDELTLRVRRACTDEGRARILGDAKKYYQDKLAHGNCTKIPKITILVDWGLEIREYIHT